jgi:hypothetical protein
MPITKNTERQSTLLAWVDINLADVATNVQSNVAIDLPVGAVILSGQLITTEAWNSTTSDVMDVGDASSATRYLTDGNIRALGARVPLVPTGFISTGEGLRVTWTSGGGTPTTGKVRLEVEYYIKGRATSTVG